MEPLKSVPHISPLQSYDKNLRSQRLSDYYRQATGQTLQQHSLSEVQSFSGYLPFFSGGFVHGGKKKIDLEKRSFEGSISHIQTKDKGNNNYTIKFQTDSYSEDFQGAFYKIKVKIVNKHILLMGQKFTPNNNPTEVFGRFSYDAKNLPILELREDVQKLIRIGLEKVGVSTKYLFFSRQHEGKGHHIPKSYVGKHKVKFFPQYSNKHQLIFKVGQKYYRIQQQENGRFHIAQKTKHHTWKFPKNSDEKKQKKLFAQMFSISERILQKEFDFSVNAGGNLVMHHPL